jgi:hypothetical protein
MSKLAQLLPKRPCQTCDRPECDGKQETLRVFQDWSDLTDHASEDTIVGWVNDLHKLREQRRKQSRLASLKQRELVKLAEEAGLS